MENSQRVDVHPYEEAQGFQRLLDLPGYDVAALVDKSGKSASHIYARLSLLQLIPEVAEAFTQERITASHANLIARLPQEHQAAAFEQCWRKDWQDSEPHLLPAKHLSAWIQANLYLSLADAPFDREDSTLNPVAGACTHLPTPHRVQHFPLRRCTRRRAISALTPHASKPRSQPISTASFAARPELVQIENGWRHAREQRPGALQRHQFRELDATGEPGRRTTLRQHPDRHHGLRQATWQMLTVCTDHDCPIHDPREAARRAAEPAPEMPPAPEHETDEEAEQRRAEHEQRRKEYEAEQERRAEERRQEMERQEQEYEAEQARREELRQAREATYNRILENAPATLSAAQLRVLLRAIVNLDPYTFADDLAEEISAEQENEPDHRSAEEVLLSTLDGTTDDKLTGFALRLALSGHRGIPRENEPDFLAEADAAFAPIPAPERKPKTPKVKKPALVLAKKKSAAKKNAAA